MLSTEIPLEDRRRILARAMSGLVPYLVATILAAVSAYATLAICGALAVFYALPIAQRRARRGISSIRPWWPSPPPRPPSTSSAPCWAQTACSPVTRAST